MRIFVFEYITGGGQLGKNIASSLRREGDFMLTSLVADLSQLHGVDVVTTRDARLDRPDLQAEVHYLNRTEDFWQHFRALATGVDAVWVIAPETGGILVDLIHCLDELGVTTLNCTSHAVRIATSKLATYHCLRESGIDVVPTYFDDMLSQELAGQCVLKPDDGAGCENTWLINAYAAATVAAPVQDTTAKYVLQPFIHGTPASMCILADDKKACLLSINLQHVTIENSRFHLHGVTVGAITDSDGVYQNIASRLFDALPGLRGVFGVDLILTDRGPLVLEVNPRLTTSYAGLSRALGVNPAAGVLEVLCARPRGQVAQSASGPFYINLETDNAA